MIILKTVFSLVLFFSLSSAEALELKTEFNQLTIDENDMNKLVAASQKPTLNEVLSETKAQFPELLIIIMRPVPQFPHPTKITWTDSEVSADDTQWYEDHHGAKFSDSAGLFLGTFEEIVAGMKRPHDDRPILFVRKNAPIDVIQHEIIHYLIFRARVAKYGAPKELGLQSQLVKTIGQLSEEMFRLGIDDMHLPKTSADLKIYQSYYLNILNIIPYRDAEEIDVVNLLVANRTELKLPLDRAQFQVQYMYENFYGVVPLLQEGLKAQKVLKAQEHLGESAVSLSKTFDQVFNQMADAYNRSGEKFEKLAQELGLN